MLEVCTSLGTAALLCGRKKSIQDHLNIKTFLTQEALTGGTALFLASKVPSPGPEPCPASCWEAAGASTQPGHHPVPGAGAQLPAGASWTCSAAALRRELFGFYFYRSLRGLCDVLTDPFVSGCRSSSQPAAPGDTRGICRGLTSASQLHAALPTPVVKAAII